MTRVKICGILDLATAKHAVECGADYLGFVFAKSRRQISLENARTIISQLPDAIQTVGVFVDASVEEMSRTAEFCGLDLIQIHGQRKEYLSDFPYPIIQSVAVKSPRSLDQTASIQADYLLFDTWDQRLQGGTGRTFDWTLLKDHSTDIPYFIAGGLAPDNVGDAIRIFTPYAVDVSSGVETDGVKDLEKIKRFIEAVKEATNELQSTQ